MKNEIRKQELTARLRTSNDVKDLSTWHNFLYLNSSFQSDTQRAPSNRKYIKNDYNVVILFTRQVNLHYSPGVLVTGRPPLLAGIEG